MAPLKFASVYVPILTATIFLGGVAAVQSTSRMCISDNAHIRAARRLIFNFGYDCKVVDYICAHPFTEGETVSCNKSDQLFRLENRGGHWLVKAYLE